MKNAQTAIPHPPKAASQFLAWALPDSIVEPVLGDLSEEYIQRISNNKLIAAKTWYWRQAVKSGIQFMFKTQRGFVMFIFSIFLFVAMTMLLVTLSGAVSTFIDVQTIIGIFPPAIAFTYAATSKKNVHQAFSILINNTVSQSERSYLLSRRVFIVLGNSGVILGVFITLIGWTAMGANMNDLSSFGTAFSFSILGLMYGIALKMVCYVAEKKIQTLSETEC
jgi:chemotaxis protein MotA